jgi:recombination protein RecT
MSTENKPQVQNTNVQTQQPKTLAGLLSQDAIKKRFQDIMGEKSNAFISSIISATKATPSLMQCEPESIISSAVIAATLDLPIQPSLGFAWMVPYGKKASFQIGFKGLVQLAMRTGQYKTINTTEVYEGELMGENRFTGEYEFNPKGKRSDTIVGYMAYFRLLNGYEKTLYWSKEKVEFHAKRFSKTFGSNSGVWATDFDSMAMKTVLKALLSKYGILSVEMQTAVISDQAIINEDGKIEYVDNEHTVITDDGLHINTNPTKETKSESIAQKARAKIAEEPIQEAQTVSELPFADVVEGEEREFNECLTMSDFMDEKGFDWTKIESYLKEKGIKEYENPDNFYKFAPNKLINSMLS